MSRRVGTGRRMVLTDERRAMVEGNMRLVHHVVKRYFPILLGDDDVLSEGYVGLCKAAATFNGSSKFSTYACTCIRNNILMWLRWKRTVGRDVLPLDKELDDGEKTFMDSVQSQEGGYSAAEWSDVVQQALECESERNRWIFWQRVYDVPFDEIVPTVGISQPGCSRVVMRIRRRIQSALKDKECA